MTLRVPCFSLAAVVAAACAALPALAAKPGSGSPGTVFPVIEVAPEDLSQGEAQSLVVIVANDNGGYDVHSSPKLLQNGDQFTVQLGSACVTTIHEVVVTENLSGSFSVSPSPPFGGSSFTLTYSGAAASFGRAAELRARVLVTTPSLAGNCLAPLGDPAHPHTITCAASVQTTSAAGTFNPTSSHASLAVGCESDVHGLTGPQGAQGPVGPAGPAGPVGATGAQGPQGSQGAQGPQGPAGPAGPQGVTGAQGPAGPIGEVGATGPQGPQGPVGPTGAPGATGPQGVTGATGAPGPAGAAGPVGAQGSTGAQGPVGPQGAAGAAGPAGPQGPMGVTGPQGAPGPTGAQGAAGAAGPVGPTGNVGPAGVTGPAGPAGAVGPQGSTGPQGPQGAVGSEGPPGLEGSQGPAGLDWRAKFTRATLMPGPYDTGQRSSITIGSDGLPLIVTRMGSQVMVLHCDDPACASWSETPLGLSALYTAVTVRVGGLPLLVGGDGSNIAMARCLDVACLDTFSGSFSADSVTREIAVAVGRDEKPVIAWYALPGVVKVRHCADADCDGIEGTTDVSSTADEESMGLAIGADGLPVIVHPEGSGARVIHCSDPACTSSTSSLVTLPATVRETRVAVAADGMPLLALRLDPDFELWTVHCDDLGCATWSSAQVADPAGAVPGTAIAVGPDGLGTIAYYDDTPSGSNGVLQVARCADAPCTAVTVVTLDSSVTRVGRDPALTIGLDGFPVVAYRDVTNSDLRAAHCTNAFCTPFHRAR